MSAKDAPKFRISEIVFFERDLKLRLPFRFGVVTLTHATQAFARVRITMPDGRDQWGASAEILAPKWFDKNPALSDQDNANQLRVALASARELYLSDATPRSAFGHFAAHYRPQITRCGTLDLNPLVANFGPAMLDRAVLDALCRVHGISVFSAMRVNMPGIMPALPDLVSFDIDDFLAGVDARTTIAARHTIGLVDPIVATDRTAPANDGLPETLEEVIAAYGHRWFKLKVGGDLASDIERLQAIARVLDRMQGSYFATLDGNEQYDSPEAALALWRRMMETPPLRRLCASIVFMEQPITRKVALERPLGPLAQMIPVIIDESDQDLDAFPRALELGYAGVSSKSCKGLYKSILNAARCRHRRTGFLSGEDLTTQAGLAVQQDLALVSVLGLEHVERNGHHYVDGMAGLPRGEQDAFLKAHPDLYQRSHGAVRLRIVDGELAIRSLDCPGFAAAVEPDWSAMRAVS